MENIDIIATINQINHLHTLQSIKNYYEEERTKVNNTIEKANNAIRRLLENEHVKLFLDNKLEEGIKKFNLNEIKGKSTEQTIETQTTWSSGTGEKQKRVDTYPNPRGEFRPSKDMWEFVSLERNKDGLYKLTVDNVKGRQHIGAFNWIADYYYTDWFDFN